MNDLLEQIHLLQLRILDSFGAGSRICGDIVFRKEPSLYWLATEEGIAVNDRPLTEETAEAWVKDCGQLRTLLYRKEDQVLVVPAAPCTHAPTLCVLLLAARELPASSSAAVKAKKLLAVQAPSPLEQILEQIQNARGDRRRTDKPGLH